MTKFKIINLFDKLFITICMFLVIYAWLNFFIRDLWSTFLLSLVFTFASVFILFYIINLRNEKKNATKTYQKDMEEKFLAFRLLNKNEKLFFLKSIFEKVGKCEKHNDCLTCYQDDKKYQIVIATHLEKLTQFELINLISNLKNNIDVLKIVCCDFEDNLNTNILKNLEIELIPKKKLYDEYFLRHNTFPNCSNLNTEKSRVKFSILLKNFINPSKAKSYFFCGLILIFSSIILPYHFYYLIFGSILLILSIVCKLKSLFKAK